MDKICIHKIGESKVIDFAGEELSKYITLITENVNVVISSSDLYEEKGIGYFYIGKFQDFNIESLPQIKDCRYDDGIYVNVEKGRGVIAGTNDRSILIGVYRFLTELGCKWTRPGIYGEVLVKKPLQALTVSVKEEAVYRHRGIVIEGANSLENVLDVIEWAPKVGYNSYFMQFKEGYTFFERWYNHRYNSSKAPEKFCIEKAQEFTHKLEEEIKLRGMIYHGVGHGWTCEALGIKGLGWDVENYAISEKQKGYLAEMNGKREFYTGIALNTNLCYSNPEVQELITNHIVEYLEKNDQIDLLHFWLADDFNNFCECEACSKLLPSDYYIEMLNLIDEKLTSRGSDKKIVFLIYYELLWTPKEKKIKNPDRFVMMFAPISRTFSKSYKELKKPEITQAYVKNKIKLPRSIEENVGFLKAWQEIFKGDSFDFDYPLGRAHYGDLGYYNIAKVISEDIPVLRDLGLNGYLSCQQQRSYFPTALPNYVMAKKLWNSTVDFEDITKEYFENSFGPDWKKSKEYLKTLSEVFDLSYWHEQKDWKTEGLTTQFAKIDNVVKEFKKVIEKNLHAGTINENKSWEYLSYHSTFCTLFAKVFMSKAEGDEEGAIEHFNKTIEYLRKIEDHIQPVFDVYRFIDVGSRKLNIKVL